MAAWVDHPFLKDHRPLSESSASLFGRPPVNPQRTVAQRSPGGVRVDGRAVRKSCFQWLEVNFSPWARVQRV